MTIAIPKRRNWTYALGFNGGFGVVDMFYIKINMAACKSA
jgi:hypothetical protein